MNKYKQLIATLETPLKSEGFIKKGETFYLYRNNNWGLINFQKSKSSSTEKISFTFNLGITSTRLRKVINNVDIEVKPSIEDCHWKKRVGFMLSQKQDHWWQINDSTSLEHLFMEITTILKTLAIPEIDNHITDSSLEKEWLSGIAEGVTELQRYIYLTTLLKLNGDEKLPMVIGELMTFSKGKSYEYSARVHIKELEKYA
jgi:hypothetical protein